MEWLITSLPLRVSGTGHVWEMLCLSTWAHRLNSRRRAQCGSTVHLLRSIQLLYLFRPVIFEPAAASYAPKPCQLGIIRPIYKPTCFLTADRAAITSPAWA